MCGVGAKSVAHLMKFHLLQWEVVKGKFLMNSNMTLTVLNLQQKTEPKVQQDFIGQGYYHKVKGQIKVTPWCCTPTTLNQCPYQASTFYTLWFPRYSLDKILYVKVTTQDQRSNQGQTMTLHTYTPYSMSLPSINFLHLYSFLDVARTRFYRSRSLQQGQIKVRP